MSSQRKIDRLAILSQNNICDGTREEPRVYFDQIPLDFSVINEEGIFNSDSNAFINGERFPVRITHALFSLGEQYSGPGDNILQVGPTLPIQLLEAVDLRIRQLDSYYMNEGFIAVPAWMTKVTSMPTAFGDQGAVMTFERPVILSSRDSLEVQTSALFDTTSNGAFVADVTVSFTGIGVQSKRPYFMSSTRRVTDSKPVTFDTADLQNNGSEPIALTDMTFQQRTIVQVIQDDPQLSGSVRAWSIQCRQNGNGTNAKWFSTPSFPTPLARINASNIGVTAGPAIVHKFPGDGWLLEPNQGFRMQARVRALAPAAIEAINPKIPLLCSVAGYIIVT